MSTDHGHQAYTAYGRAAAHKLPDGKTKLPKWDDLDDKQQRAWAKSAGAAAAAAMVALADRIDGGGPSSQMTLLLREEAGKLAAADPNDPDPDGERAAAQADVPVDPALPMPTVKP